MTAGSPPLLDLFERLHAAGLPLGVADYMAVLRALQAGFGTDRRGLERICKRVWAKSKEQERLVEECLAASDVTPALEAAQAARQSGAAATAAGPAASTPPAEATATGTPGGTGQTAAAQRPAPVSSATLGGQSVEQEGKPLYELRYAVERVVATRFLLNAEYFPVTTRQMKQAWRYLRRQAEGRLTRDVDVPATVTRLARRGVLEQPVMLRRRQNYAQMLLLVDRQGSMVPFHALGNHLADTAVNSGRFARAAVFYFHNVLAPDEPGSPDHVVFRTPELAYPVTLRRALAKFDPEQTSALIFSDAGAARGGYSRERLLTTARWLQHLETLGLRSAVWLNPMRRGRWDKTTACEIADLLPMFPADRVGLNAAIDALRGRDVSRTGC